MFNWRKNSFFDSIGFTKCGRFDIDSQKPRIGVRKTKRFDDVYYRHPFIISANIRRAISFPFSGNQDYIRNLDIFQI